jgi:hypothetical protein
MTGYVDYLDIIDKALAAREGRDISDISDKTYTESCSVPGLHNSQSDFRRLSRFGRTLRTLESRCPAHVEVEAWKQAVDDARRFVAQWGDKAERFGWTARDLFGLAPPPDKPGATYHRLGRCDLTGLVWLLHGRPVVALTERSAAIRGSSGATLTYYRRAP